MITSIDGGDEGVVDILASSLPFPDVDSGFHTFNVSVVDGSGGVELFA
jgi:hypothetical protein